MGTIIIGEKEHSIFGPSRLWTKTGIEIKPGAGARKRVDPIELVVWHYTAGEGSARALYNTMRSRKLGVEFFIDRDGTVWQFCDPIRVDTFDAGIANRRSVGVEIACYGTRKNVEAIPTKGRDRRTYIDTVHGKSIVFAHFYPAQIAAAISLAFALSDALSIPLWVPVRNGELLRGVLTPTELAEFFGHIGHYHITTRKVDPGTALLDAFRTLFMSGLRETYV